MSTYHHNHPTTQSHTKRSTTTTITFTHAPSLTRTNERRRTAAWSVTTAYYSIIIRWTCADSTNSKTTICTCSCRFSHRTTRTIRTRPKISSGAIIRCTDTHTSCSVANASVRTLLTFTGSSDCGHGGTVRRRCTCKKIKRLIKVVKRK